MAKWASRLDGIQERARAKQSYRNQLGTASATRRPLGCGVEEVEGSQLRVPDRGIGTWVFTDL